MEAVYPTLFKYGVILFQRAVIQMIDLIDLVPVCLCEVVMCYIWVVYPWIERGLMTWLSGFKLFVVFLYTGVFLDRL